MTETVLRTVIANALSDSLGEAMDCTRVWSAWGYGTMSEDDFEIIADDPERLDELTQAVLNSLSSDLIPFLEGVIEDALYNNIHSKFGEVAGLVEAEDVILSKLSEYLQGDEHARTSN